MKLIRVLEADLDDPMHQEAVIELLDAYSRDPMANGAPLSPTVRETLIPGLRQHPTTIIFLAFQGEHAVGIAVCFLGFSTFAAKPLLNIHDLAVLPGCRDQGVGRRLLESVERKARAMGCCKLTLEMQENNHKARRVYESAGFSQAVYQQAAGGSLFFTKSLQPRRVQGASQ